MYQQYNNSSGGITQMCDTMSLNDLDNMLTRETAQNKTQGWNKLDKTVKIEKLNIFAKKYGETNDYNEEQINSLKRFLRDCLDKSKLKNTKDIYYNKETNEVVNIPSLSMNSETHNFTLRNVEVSVNKKTLKNIPSRNISIKDKKIIKNNISASINIEDEKMNV
jgi:hypothetical protein